MASLLNTSSVSAGERRRHATQPEDQLIPATVEFDDEGNPYFYYPESTPRKGSPKIVTPRSILNRLSKTRAGSTGNHRHHPRSKFTKFVEHDAQQQQQQQQQQPKVVSLHHSLLDGDHVEFYHDDEDENLSITSKEGSLASVSSLSKLKLKLRLRGTKHKKKGGQPNEAFTAPLSPLRVSQTTNKAALAKVALHRLASDAGTESTRSLSSRAFSVSDMLDQDPPSSFSFKVPEEVLTPIKEPVRKEAVPTFPETPPPVATLMSAMESAGLSNKARRALAPSLQQQRPKTRNHVSAIKPGASRAVVVSTDQPSVVSQSQASRRPSSTKSASSSKSVISATSSSHPGNKDFKVFLLLLHPSSKIFELIQLYFNPTTTSIRDVINMIPANATEPALGAQDYTGLCRSSSDDPEEREIADLDLLVQNHDNMKNSAQVVRGEILVAIPIGYSARRIAKLSQQILVNPRICRLLESSNPLEPKLQRKKKTVRKDGRHRRSSARSSSRKVSVKVVDNKHEETTNMPSPTMSVQHAMENAASAAAAANAAVHELHLPSHRGSSLLAAAGRKYRYPQGRRNSDNGSGCRPSTPGTDCSMSLESALRSMGSSVATKTDCSLTDVSETSYSLKSYENQSIGQSSVDESYSTWSKSLDTSFAAGSVYSSRVELSSVPLVQTARNSVVNTAPVRRRKRQMRLIRRATICVVALMTVPYFSDANGFALRHVRVENTLQQAFGVAGLLQFICVFLVLIKLQYLCTMPPIRSNNKGATKCPLMKVRASILAAHSQTHR